MYSDEFGNGTASKDGVALLVGVYVRLFFVASFPLIQKLLRLSCNDRVLSISELLSRGDACPRTYITTHYLSATEYLPRHALIQ